MERAETETSAGNASSVRTGCATAASLFFGESATTNTWLTPIATGRCAGTVRANSVDVNSAVYARKQYVAAFVQCLNGERNARRIHASTAELGNLTFLRRTIPTIKKLLRTFANFVCLTETIRALTTSVLAGTDGECAAVRMEISFTKESWDGTK